MTLARTVLVALTLAVHTTLAQQPAEPLRGRVVDADNGRPLRRVIVAVARGEQVRPVLTDEDGRFAIDLPAVASAIVITKAGYASTVIEPDRRTRPPRELDIRLPRGAAISGRVMEQGMPSVGAHIVARQIDAASDVSPTYEAVTDDLGEYRLGGLPAGQYSVVSFNGPQGIRISVPGTQQTMYGELSNLGVVQGIVTRRTPFGTLSLAPGAPGLTTEPRLIEVKNGEELSDVDFQTTPLDVSRPPAPGATAAFLRSNENDPGAVSGRVVTPLGQPVSGALVMISGNNQSRMVSTDVSGQFDAGRFKDGDYRIEMGRSGFLTPDSRGVPDTEPVRTIHIGGDSRIHNLELILARGGSIAGTIVDAAGEPFQGVFVRALRVRQVDARRVATIAGWPRLTDDRGRYRMFGLPPGEYVIVASLEATERIGTRVAGFAPVYYPGTAHVESAQTVQVEFERATAGTDLTFAVSSTARVTGRALNAVGEPLVGRVALGISFQSGSVVAEPRFTKIQPDGSFELTDVAPGEYILQALGDRGPGVAPEFGAEYITVGDQNSPPLTIKTAAGATLDGRFVSEGQTTIPLRAQSLHAAPLDFDRSPPGGRGPEGLAVHDDGRFYLTGLYGPMRLTYPAPSGWYLKSLTVGGVDVTDVPVDFGFGDEIFPDAQIVLSNRGAIITGSIEDAGDKPALGSVVIFSATRLNWFEGSRYLKRTVSTADGVFEVNGIPPGEYFLAAVASLPPDWQSSQVLETLVRGATRVTAREGQTQTIELRLIRR